MTTDSPIWTPARHPLARFLRELATGNRPPTDGGWLRVTPWAPHVQGILSFPGHAVLAVSYDHTEVELSDLGVDGCGGAHHPRVVTALAKDGWIDSLDLLFLGAGLGEQPGTEPLVTRHDLARIPLVEHARRVCSEVQVFGRPDPGSEDVVVLSRGIGGLRELFFHLAPQRRGHGHGVELVRAALRAVPENELVVACSAPANRPAVLTLERAGLAPVGSVQLFSDRPERRS
ncbi:GNAT family protein [Gephyromycinifex aptenodytis]|uniref:GNAT family protein n=1 Tax=Gephyromycinifex aptenodytis TaxID=2716227 RepID=UPI001445F25D|nr:GNAT family protein [Gephyromycinifex aptenodytis]